MRKKRSATHKLMDAMSLKEARIVRRRFMLLALASIIIVTIGTVMMHLLEDLAPIDALYFSVVSLLTVGYGDFTPQSTAGKLFVMAYLLVGIGIIAALINNLVRGAIAGRVINNRKNK